MNLIRKVLAIVMLVAILGPLQIVTGQGYEVKIGSTSTGNNSDIIDYDIPNRLSPGQDYNVNITIVNTGSRTWTRGNNYHLKVYDIAENNYQLDAWGLSRIEIPNDVLPSDKVTFSFKITAPKTSGVYNLRWAMAEDNQYFGEYTNNSVSVGGDNIPQVSEFNGNNSEFVSVSVPETMNTGEKYLVRLTLKNSGNTEWLSASTHEYKVSPVVESSELTYPGWNSAPVFLSGSVEAGQTSDIEFYVTAPLDQGVYYLQWMMKKGDNYFGQKSNRFTVNVTGNSGKTIDSKSYNSSFMEQKVPTTMTFNELQEITITVSNTGNVTWKVGREQLVIIDAKKTATSLNLWNVGYMQLPHDVDPGGLVTFNFTVKPTETGWQYFQCSMMSDDGNLFGTPSKSVEVLISK